MNLLSGIRGRFAGKVAISAAATATQAILGFVLIPFATLVLDASDFGYYGLLMSAVALASAVADSGAAFVFPVHLSTTDAPERARMFVSFALISGVVGLTLGILLVALWPWRGLLVEPAKAASVPLLALVLTGVLMPLRSVGGVVLNLLYVTGRGPAIAAQIMAQAVTAFTLALLGLFVFHLHVSALVLGALCGQLAALATGAALLGRAVVSARPSRRWFRAALSSAPTAGVVGLVEGVRSFLENAILARGAGLSSVGYLGHARLYQGLANAMMNAVGYNVWSISLNEAEQPASRFATTDRVWAPIQLGLALFGVLFAFAGREIVDTISHGKLTPAAAYVPFLIVIALVQNSGKAATAAVYVDNRGLLATRFRLGAIILGSLLIWPAVRRFGLMGLIAILTAEALAHRLCIRILAALDRRVPFQDGIVVVGIVAILVALVLMQRFAPGPVARLILLCGFAVFVLAAGRKTVADVLLTGRNLLSRPPT